MLSAGTHHSIHGVGDAVAAPTGLGCCWLAWLVRPCGVRRAGRGLVALCLATMHRSGQRSMRCGRLCGTRRDRAGGRAGGRHRRWLTFDAMKWLGHDDLLNGLAGAAGGVAPITLGLHLQRLDLQVDLCRRPQRRGSKRFHSPSYQDQAMKLPASKLTICRAGSRSTPTGSPPAATTSSCWRSRARSSATPRSLLRRCSAA